MLDPQKLSELHYEFYGDAVKTLYGSPRTDDLTGLDLQLYSQRILALLDELQNPKEEEMDEKIHRIAREEVASHVQE
jgi:hypothetical protein